MKGKMKGIIAIGMVAALFILTFLIYIYHKQYNWNGYSHYLIVTFSEDKGMRLLAEKDDTRLYSYHVKDAKVSTVFSNHVSLEKLLFDKITIDDLTSSLDKHQEGDVTIYEWENYQIVEFDATYVITDKDETLKNIQKQLENRKE